MVRSLNESAAKLFTDWCISASFFAAIARHSVLSGSPVAELSAASFAGLGNLGSLYVDSVLSFWQLACSAKRAFVQHDLTLMHANGHDPLQYGKQHELTGNQSSGVQRAHQH